jgi:hypothetical protein
MCLPIGAIRKRRRNMATSRSKKSKKALSKAKRLPSVKPLSRGKAPYLTYTITDVVISG